MRPTRPLSRGVPKCVRTETGEEGKHAEEGWSRERRNRLRVLLPRRAGTEAEVLLLPRSAIRVRPGAVLRECGCGCGEGGFDSMLA